MAAHVTAKGVLRQDIVTSVGVVMVALLSTVGVVFAAYLTGVMSGKNEQPTVTVTTARTVLKTPSPRPGPTVTKTVGLSS